MLRRYWIVDEETACEVEEAIASGVEATVSVAAPDTMMVRVDVAVRPVGSVAT
jgi:hypothetical protein